MDSPVITTPLRTAVGKEGGQWAWAEPEILGSHVVIALLSRIQLPPEEIADVLVGNYFSNQGTARRIALLSGIPDSVPAVGITRACGSGLQAIVTAAQGVMLGDGDAYIAGGAESMSRAPYLLSRPERPYQRKAPQWVTGRAKEFGRPNLGLGISMGETAENVAEEFGVSRADQDAFALQSQKRTEIAMREDHFKTQIVPFNEINGKRKIEIDTDQGPRPDTTLEVLGRLPPAFRAGGSVTAGNSCLRSDGAAMAVVTRQDVLSGLQNVGPSAYIRGWAVAGVDPRIMGIGPVPALRKATTRAGVALQDLEIIELNEAFASQSVAVIRELGLDPERVNPSGGAISLGHPIGASGAILVTKLLYNLERLGRRWGAVTMCIGGGMGIAAIFERIARDDR